MIELYSLLSVLAASTLLILAANHVEPFATIEANIITRYPRLCPDGNAYPLVIFVAAAVGAAVGIILNG